MKFSGSDSWEISVREWDGQFDTALWIRAAERIEVPAAGVVTMPLDLEELPLRAVPPEHHRAAGGGGPGPADGGRDVSGARAFPADT